MKRSVGRLVRAALLCAGGAAVAAGGGGEGAGSSAPADPAITQAQEAIAKQDWSAAQGVMKQALVANPKNAEYHNLYAYSTRKGASPDMNLVFRHYNEALRLNPKHLGAHEYIGEAYLAVDDLPKAKEHLAALDRLCFFGCEEYTDLKKAVAAYEASGKR
ncbi:tetratricopeptide repeat protein [Piscinibacter sp.]|uniref:tetratricopeptide repeat protein n=1 Tax=Piscinibacter sp. TaxID=1903157 RepID=UPI002B830A8A|nr:hypothetical protein [Albitalea sp.]HUG22281.1 hypothetical protein [Albitalea sp.]